MMEKMTAFTDSEYTYLHEFDLDGIKERVENRMGNGVMAAKVLEVDAPALVAEVERLKYDNKGLREELEIEKDLSEARYECLKDVLEENERLREALRFYANEKTYMQMSSEEPPDIWSDDGSIAREALGGEPDE